MMSAARGWDAAIAIGAGGALLLVLLASGAMSHPVHYDELLHILSARGLLLTGYPVIADGVYPRAELFTRIVASSLSHFGDSAESARLPALAAAAALALVLGLWVVRQSGAIAGATAVVVLSMVPGTVGVAVFARFYTVHAVLMLLMFIATHEAMRPARRAWARLVAAGAAVALVPIGLQFQETTVIAAGAAAAAAVTLFLMDHWTQVVRVLTRRPVVTVTALGMVAAAALVAVESLGLFHHLGTTALWAAGNAARYQYYLVEFRGELPLLWPLFPAAVAIGVLLPEHRRLALFCAVAVASALLVHSVAAQKSTRYVYYLVPLMCALWGIGLANVVAVVVRRGQASDSRGARGSALVTPLVLGAVFLLSQEGARALNLALERGQAADRPYAQEPDWTASVVVLGPRARDAEVVITSNSMKALYYLGRYDYELNATIVPETETHAEFGRDRRTGRQAIGTADSIRQVLSGGGETLVVLEISKIGRSSGVNEQAFAVIESYCEELPLPGDKRVRAWRCPAHRT